ncbi:hypothetical protein NDU88_001835 [Pleurodeles waltl]|uniref:Uncharacterized protein n=1 Tax=Pleurodeles waltl TaxID=8319 RepID=A0AAV7VAX0_PLEWA|nr:hypothetical protein NDU88_001835 [Pleurodeles waltl]
MEGRGDGIKNPEHQVISATLHIIREHEERAKDTRNLINECPETQQEKVIEWEKEKSTVGENVAKDWTFETRKAENDGKSTDWFKDGGDTFYSLMEESEAGSSGCNLSEEDQNASSTSKSLSSAVGPTVRPQRRQRKLINSRIGSGDSPGECAETLNWDYSGIKLSQPRKDCKVPKDMSLILYSVEDENITDGQTNNMASADTKLLHLIYGTVRAANGDTGGESKSPNGHQTATGCSSQDS